MKKLALALVCLVSVAFFASCDPKVENPEPVVSIVEADGYLYDSAVIEVNVDYAFAFKVTANTETLKDIVRVELLINDEPYDTVENIDAQEYTYEGIFNYQAKEIIDEVVLALRATDADNETTTAKMHLWINQEEYLVATPIVWTKIGHNVDDLSAYGLVWKETNYKSPFTHIFPAEGCTLYVVEEGAEEDYKAIETVVDLATYYSKLSETMHTADEYDKIDCNASGTYHHMLVTKDAQGTFHAIYIEKAEISTPAACTQIVITGEAK